MDASEAREHLELVEKIIAVSSRKLEVGGEFFVAWGVASAFFTSTYQLALDGRIPAAWFQWSYPVVYVAAIVFSVVRGRYYRLHGKGMTLLQREFMNVLTLTMSLAFITDVVGFHIFTGWALAAIWTVAACIVLFFIGMHGNVRATACGILMLASLAIANFVTPIAGYALAAGFLVGYAGFGLFEMLAHE
jgi:hypothetical protein